jgi:hypothetical protein
MPVVERAPGNVNGPRVLQMVVGGPGHQCLLRPIERPEVLKHVREIFSNLQQKQTSNVAHGRPWIFVLARPDLRVVRAPSRHWFFSSRFAMNVVAGTGSALGDFSRRNADQLLLSRLERPYTPREIHLLA